MRRNLGRHANGNARRAVQQHKRQLGRQLHRFLKIAVVIGLKIHRPQIYFFEQKLRNGRETGFRITHRRCRVAVAGTEITFRHKERIAKRKGLSHAHQGVIHRLVTVRMIFAEHVTHNTGAFDASALKFQPHPVHVYQDAALDRFLPVGHFRKRSALHHRHGVFKISL